MRSSRKGDHVGAIILLVESLPNGFADCKPRSRQSSPAGGTFSIKDAHVAQPAEASGLEPECCGCKSCRGYFGQTNGPVAQELVRALAL